MGSGNSQPQIIFVNRKKKTVTCSAPNILEHPYSCYYPYLCHRRAFGLYAGPADLPSQTAISEGSLSQENCTLCSHPYLAPGRAKNFCTLRASLEEAFKSNLHLSLGNGSPRLGWKSLEHPRSILVLRFKKYSHLWLVLCSSPELAFLFHNVVRNKT